MKSLFQLKYRLSFLIIIILAISCKKDSSVDEQNELVYPVLFKFSDFIGSEGLLKTSSINNSTLKIASNGGSQSYSEGYLYFWSFNNETLLPDVKYKNQAIPTITYNSGIVPSNTSYIASNYVFDQYAAGKALNLTGAKDILIKMPIEDVMTVKSLGFDIGSSNTGPKDFEVFYSIDEGDSYTEISLVNQFGSFTANAKHSYTYDLLPKNIAGEELWIKIVLKAGERGTSSAYNANSGALRLDNLHLIGIAPTSSTTASINKLHYFLFHKDKSEIIYQGQLDYADNLALDLKLGDYDVFFIANKSDMELVFPQQILKSSDLFSANIFSNKSAEIFGYVGHLSVNGSVSANIILQRLYSQVKVEFTDNVDLGVVSKLVINQLHEPFFYSPFTLSLTNPVIDQSTIIFEENFQQNKQIVFNQFMGFIDTAKPIEYTVHVYGTNGIIRTFTLKSLLKNNMQLVFRGELLKDVDGKVGFQIVKNENWDGSQTNNF